MASATCQFLLQADLIPQLAQKWQHLDLASCDVCLGFSLIVMYDAIGVRRHAGMQAEVLNMIVEDLFQGHPIRKRKLKELLGHTPSQVLAGALLGFVVACICHRACLVAA
ncbi:uncharacterized protein LOC115677989 isoform X3 [Syzygium oleosum]|uniref:uncharacterized protein LOC115677989 isoform X3 n=1 Tax=Syzygium oleosum TaxID=219896 RepID=UPI0024B89A62|nr:uncharacterized protein LOC115677989 isoform X3 [Syzygium oleosum]